MASQSSTDFLQIPTRYGLKVEDIVHFQRDRQTSPSKQDGTTSNGRSSGPCTPSPTAGAGSVLVAKVCDALIRHGYEKDIVEKVGRLVVANLMTCASTQVGEEAGLEMVIPDEDERDDSKETQKKVELMLKGMLDRNAARSRTVNVNSNEPVLLINGFDQIEKEQLVLVVRKTVQQLQKDWNIWPVRVYAGRYFQTSGTGFSISLLNVVNTEIGGPNMVQLLDEASIFPVWNQFLRREFWRDREFLYSEEGHSGHGEEEEDDISDGGSVHSVESNSSYAAESVLRLVIEKSPIMAQSPSPAEIPPVIEQALDGPSTSERVDADQQIEVVDEDASFAVLETEQGTSGATEQEIQERNIVHPTWNRRHDSTSLIDLIRSQALDIPPLGADEDARVEAVEKAADEPLPSEPSKKDDDSFVLL